MYDVTSPRSIVEFAKKLKGSTLREICSEEIEKHNYKGKGNYGQLLEKFYFGYEPNSNAEPDFKEVGIELKSSPLKLLKNGAFRSKERLVLNIIDYKSVYQEAFETSAFWKKNAHLLLVFYLHDSDGDLLDHRISLVEEWKYSSKDLLIIKRDWQTIRDKIKAGKAEELSEGDTYYLGACTKGGKGGNLRDQPFSDIPAKQRAFSLKQGYVNHVIATIAQEEAEEYGKLIPTLEIAAERSIEEVVLEKFDPLLGLTQKQIIEKFGLEHIDPKRKDLHAALTKYVTHAVFNVPPDKSIEDHIEEFSKAELGVRTIRLRADGMPCEDVSLPAFSFTEIYEGEWRNSRLKAFVERRYLFIFFRYNKEGELFLDKVKFWNMPNNDIAQAQQIWLSLKRLIINGSIVKEVEINEAGKERRRTYFPDIKTANIHIRPHGATAADTNPLPVPDMVTGKNEYTKHSFWLNKKYIKKEIYL